MRTFLPDAVIQSLARRDQDNFPDFLFAHEIRFGGHEPCTWQPGVCKSSALPLMVLQAWRFKKQILIDAQTFIERLGKMTAHQNKSLRDAAELALEAVLAQVMPLQSYIITHMLVSGNNAILSLFLEDPPEMHSNTQASGCHRVESCYRLVDEHAPVSSVR